MKFHTAYGELMSFPIDILENNIKARQLQIERLQLTIKDIKKEIEQQQTEIEGIRMILKLKSAETE